MRPSAVFCEIVSRAELITVPCLECPLHLACAASALPGADNAGLTWGRCAL